MCAERYESLEMCTMQQIQCLAELKGKHTAKVEQCVWMFRMMSSKINSVPVTTSSETTPRGLGSEAKKEHFTLTSVTSDVFFIFPRLVFMMNVDLN